MAVKSVTLTWVILLATSSLAQTGDLPARFTERLETLYTGSGVPGIQAAYIVGENTRFATAIGLADSASGRPMTLDTCLPAGSVGKSFLAAVVVDQVQKGVVDLDEPVSKWLGDEPWFARVPNGDAMTLRLLMNHASGVPDHLNDEEFMAALKAMVSGEDIDRDDYFEPRESLSYILDDPALFAPGEGSYYTDTAYLIAGLTIEKATGRGFYDLVMEGFLVPLELEGVHPAIRRDLPNLGCGYMLPDNPFGLPTATLLPDGTMNHNPGLEYTGGGFVTTTPDLARWMWLLYSGRLFPAPYLEDMLLKGHPLDPEAFGNGRYGLAVFVQESDYGEIRWHSGWYPGYNTMVQYWPEHDTLLAVQINRDYDTQLRTIAAGLAEILMSAD